MGQAKGVLPRGDDREVLYKNPRMCGYFVAVTLDPTIDRARAEALLATVGGLVDELVARLPAEPDEEKGRKVAAVAVGLAPSFFSLNGAARFEPPLAPPAAFAPDAANPMPSASDPLASSPLVAGELLFYVASVFEARVNDFISRLVALTPDVVAVSFDRGYQRQDQTEPFGYADGLRNIRTGDRPRFVFVHRDERQIEEPAWTEGGSYMAFMKILQYPDILAADPDAAAQDAVIGRTKSGTRLDLVEQGTKPRQEPSEPPPNLVGSAHVGKAGPRGKHDDTQIFRRGLPFIESTPNGSPRVGLNFCSFQASLDQFDVIFNDWMMNPHFPSEAAGADALFDPSHQPGPLTTIERAGFYFVPPHHEGGLAITVFGDHGKEAKLKEGKLVVRKRVVDATNPIRRFERGGFVFQVIDASGAPVGGQFSSDSTGRAVCPVKLQIGATYTLQELTIPVANVQPVVTQFMMERAHQQLIVINQVTQPNTPYRT